MSESALGKKLTVAWSKMGNRLFRMNSGMGWVGQSTVIRAPTQMTLSPGTVVVHNARPLHAGFTGCPDYWGFKRVVITPEMVGQTVAVFAVMETKDTGRVTKEQQNFLNMVNENGGIAKVVRQVEDSL